MYRLSLEKGLTNSVITGVPKFKRGHSCLDLTQAHMAATGKPLLGQLYLRIIEGMNATERFASR
jgi:hypothetical protein